MVKETPSTMPFSDCNEWRFLLTADIHGVLAAWSELAANRRRKQVRGTSFNWDQTFPVFSVEARDGFHESHGVRMPRFFIEIVDVRFFEYSSRVHDNHLVGYAGYDGKVMTDDDDAGFEFRFQLLHQLKDLRLNRNIQRCCWFVGNDQLRTARKRHGDHDALPHAAGVLVSYTHLTLPTNREV